MPLDRDAVRSAVIANLTPLLQGREFGEITDGTDTIRDLGLASDDGVYFACAIEVALGVVVPDDENPLVRRLPNGTKRPRPVGEVVDYLLTLPIASKEESNAQE